LQFRILNIFVKSFMTYLIKMLHLTIEISALWVDKRWGSQKL